MRTGAGDDVVEGAVDRGKHCAGLRQIRQRVCQAASLDRLFGQSTKIKSFSPACISASNCLQYQCALSQRPFEMACAACMLRLLSTHQALYTLTKGLL